MPTITEDPFKEYKKESEPEKRVKSYAWHTAIGLQAVDGLKPSGYLVQTAIRNIKGEISFERADALLQSYYKENPACDPDDRTEEADIVSVRIAALLSERAFSLTPNEYLSIHRKLFIGIFPHAGCIRDYNITKNEWVLDGDTIHYGTATELRATLEYDLSEEKKYPYKNLSISEMIHHLAMFISRLWQIHVFSEGNTRTTAVFFIKYLRTLGFDVTNDIFAEHAWYFRNALVRANYNNLKYGIRETTEYLELFLENLLLGTEHPLHNRTLHISGVFRHSGKPDIEAEKPDFDTQKPDIESVKPDIGRPLTDIEKRCSHRTAAHIQKLYEAFPDQAIFGRSDVMRVTGLKPSGASELLKKMLIEGVIESSKGCGKGKYHFSKL